MIVRNKTSFARGFGCFALVTCFVVLGLGATHAEDYTAAQRIACTPDAWRLCSGSMPFISDVKACMIANKANLSRACLATWPKETATR